MKMIRAKTLEEHREYLYSIVRLMLFWMHGWLEKHPEETFSFVLRNRVDIYRKTDANIEALNPRQQHFDEEPWLSLEHAAEAAFRACGNDRAAFEEQAFAVFRPSVDARLVRDFEDRSGLAGYQCGSLRHEVKLWQDMPVPTLGFHIANAIAPHSIFEETEYLKTCFLLLCHVAEHYYGATHIGTGTWLNQLPAWLRFFPAEWRENMLPPALDVGWHYGFWGQFISARGTFNAKYGEIVRRTGDLPHYPCRSHCSIEAMRRHLATL